MSLILGKLKSSIDTLSSSYSETETMLEENITDIIKNTLKSGVIQNFEVSYEMSWKFMKRWLEINETASSIAILTRKDLFRYAYSKNMINNIDLWFEFHAMRNESSHTYNEDIVRNIYKVIPNFINASYVLYDFLDTHNE